MNVFDLHSYYNEYMLLHCISLLYDNSRNFFIVFFNKLFITIPTLFILLIFFFISFCNDNFSRNSSVGLRNSRRNFCRNFDFFTNFHAIYTKALEKRKFVYFIHHVKIHTNGNMFIRFYCYFSFYCVDFFVTASKSADSRKYKDTFQIFEINLKEVPVGSCILYGSCSKQNV